MTSTILATPELKQMLKEAVMEALHDQRALLHEVVTEALLDIGLGEAMKEGLTSDYTSREEVFSLLNKTNP